MDEQENSFISTLFLENIISVKKYLYHENSISIRIKITSDNKKY